MPPPRTLYRGTSLIKLHSQALHGEDGSGTLLSKRDPEEWPAGGSPPKKSKRGSSDGSGSGEAMLAELRAKLQERKKQRDPQVSPPRGKS